MVASLIPFNLQVTATRASRPQVKPQPTPLSSPTGASVNLTRTVEVALLPAFEFGVFCDGDCDYFAGPPLTSAAASTPTAIYFSPPAATLTFTDKIAAVGQVIVDQLENGWPTSTNYTGTVYVPNAAGGCPAAPEPDRQRIAAALPAGSWTGGFPPTGAANPGWKGISTTTFASFIVNGLTGATKLQLPFVQSQQSGPSTSFAGRRRSTPRC